jgi:hypothetical protein
MGDGGVSGAGVGLNGDGGVRGVGVALDDDNDDANGVVLVFVAVVATVLGAAAVTGFTGEVVALCVPLLGLGGCMYAGIFTGRPCLCDLLAWLPLCLAARFFRLF